MTRARFILVSVLAAFAAMLGMNRERLARRWLERNGFVVIEYDLHFGGASGENRHCVIINHSQFRGGAYMWSSPIPHPSPCFGYLNALAEDGFTLVERHERLEYAIHGYKTNWTENDLNEPPLVRRELAPPTIHRFERPWFV